ncbi:collagen alpha-1(III) chain-like [Haliotis rubra]|uniref:collagen alpha-1(III) chain-like n=1 Tax=Haliotis rubra TaxID=36100 RepID=UPI001EE59ABC|nr:collagen alpha-1(III) chain-like [Haliotis rubra]
MEAEGWTEVWTGPHGTHGWRPRTWTGSRNPRTDGCEPDRPQEPMDRPMDRPWNPRRRRKDGLSPRNPVRTMDWPPGTAEAEVDQETGRADPGNRSPGNRRRYGADGLEPRNPPEPADGPVDMKPNGRWKRWTGPDGTQGGWTGPGTRRSGWMDRRPQEPGWTAWTSRNPDGGMDGPETHGTEWRTGGTHGTHGMDRSAPGTHGGTAGVDGPEPQEPTDGWKVDPGRWTDPGTHGGRWTGAPGTHGMGRTTDRLPRNPWRWTGGGTGPQEPMEYGWCVDPAPGTHGGGVDRPPGTHGGMDGPDWTWTGPRNPWRHDGPGNGGPDPRKPKGVDRSRNRKDGTVGNPVEVPGGCGKDGLAPGTHGGPGPRNGGGPDPRKDGGLPQEPMEAWMWTGPQEPMEGGGWTGPRNPWR